MSERKVLNKYYPPDFDPSKIPRLRLPKERQYTVRLMAPCNMRCTTCGEYIYKGKKFNARKETVQNEEYLGIKIFRFYIKCPRCLAEITFKTDPENADYIVEHGATRNFQALKLAEEAAEKEAKEKEEEEKNNPMKLLENRTKASKREMESLEALEEIREMNQHHAKVDFKQLLWQNQLKLIKEQEQQEQEDEAFIKAVFYTADGEKIKRILDEPTASVADKKDKIHDGVLTSIMHKSSFVTSESATKKQKMTEPISDSRQRNIDMLKKAVKTKKAVLGSLVKPVNEKESPVAGKSETDEQKSISKNSEHKQTGLIMLSAYSDSDSDT